MRSPETEERGARYQAAVVRTEEERAAVFAVRITVFVEEQAVPLETYRLSSEGEDNLEARLDEILAAR